MQGCQLIDCLHLVCQSLEILTMYIHTKNYETDSDIFMCEGSMCDKIK
jgi:hypothetical protein